MKTVNIYFVLLWGVLFSCGKEPSEVTSVLPLPMESFRQESVCDKDNMTHINAYRGNRGVSANWLRKHARPVGAISARGTGLKTCSGTLVSNSLFLTAKHCAMDDLEEKIVTFNYLNSSIGTPFKEFNFSIERVVEVGRNLDYAVLELKGNPGRRFGYSKVSFKKPLMQERIVIIQHPLGGPKMFDIGHLAITYGHTLRHFVDTKYGSSGAGILDLKGYVFGLHTNGGCNSFAGANSGIKLSAVPESSILRVLDKPHDLSKWSPQESRRPKTPRSEQILWD